MDLQPWEPGHKGRGILVDLNAPDSNLMLWKVDEEDRPFADDVIRSLDLSDREIVRFDISANGGVGWVARATAASNPCEPLDALRVMHLIVGQDSRLQRDEEIDQLLDDPENWEPQNPESDG
jgi:hypothetical protein